MKKWCTLLVVVVVSTVLCWPKPARLFEVDVPKSGSIVEQGFSVPFVGRQAITIGELLTESGITLAEEDSVFPAPETALVSGTTVRIVRAHQVSVHADGETRVFMTQASTVEEALLERGMRLDEDDIVKPERATFLPREIKVAITRVEIREETQEQSIAFETKVTEDATLSWRKQSISQKGEKGVKTTTYRVAYHDGKSVNRKVLQTEITKQPVTEMLTQGTKVAVGKSHSGVASWYAFTGTLSAANPWLPIGSYVRVTNTNNGKTVIVRINDRGPFAPGRIIDLDKVAFQKIASVGAGVIHVTMEEITN